MNLFETVKSAVTVKQAAEHYGCKVNRGDMICCPFHDDRHPSMKLNRDYFYCFGCGATGDVIDFVARLFGLSSYEAAKKLAYDFGLDPDKPPAAMALKKPYPLARAFRDEEMYCQRVLCDYLHLLEHWKIEYAPQSPEDDLDDRFVEACHMIEYIDHLLDVLMFAELEQRVNGGIYFMKSSIRNEIKAQIIRAGYTMQEVVDQLHDEYGWSDSVSNLSGKLQRESLRYREAVELADVLGYDIVWQKRRD